MTLELSGEWEFAPEGGAPGTIMVPGLWEAQGHLDLDGPAWYRHRFELSDHDGSFFTLRFGAVMDEAEVYLNDAHVGSHLGGYTPFEFDVTDQLRSGYNDLHVRVIDHQSSGPEHLHTAHGKQGWMNNVFPSPPSLYMSYGGIWQPVTLRRHGPVSIVDVFTNSDPDNLTITVELHNHSRYAVTAPLTVGAFGRTFERHLSLDPLGSITTLVRFGAVDAPRWTPDSPVLHTATVTVSGSDRRETWVGLRTIRVVADRIELNGTPLRIRAGLVQGFHPTRLYAEGSRSEIEAEVRAAKDVGLNTLRLHIKAFDPTYLQVCDELGMLVHSDIPVAEPVAHAELDDTGDLFEHCVRTLREQVRRDRNHPSLILWSAMNELGVEGGNVHFSEGYSRFARGLYATLTKLDPTRPVIENDWIEPDPDHVYSSTILTAHWYGRLSSRYLADLTAKTDEYATGVRPLIITEFGDWGLPDLHQPAYPTPFWWAGEEVETAIAATPWPGTPQEFVTGTQRYQGLSDRLQGEIFRTNPAVAGWCITELMDVPQEYNGLWDFERGPKSAALDEIRRLCQAVLPMLQRTSLASLAREPMELPIAVSNHGPSRDVLVTVSLEGQVLATLRVTLAAFTTTVLRPVMLTAPARAGDFALRLEVSAGGSTIGSNVYPLHVVQMRAYADPLRVVGDPLRGAPGPGSVVVGEGELDERTASAVAKHLSAEGTALVLAQPVDRATLMPIAASAVEIATEWGSTPFLFSTDDPSVPSIPARKVLTSELLSVAPDVVWTSLGGDRWAERTVVGLYKPPPGPILGTVIGSIAVGRGRLWVCQLPLAAAARRGDPMAMALLGELFSAAAVTTIRASRDQSVRS